MKTLDDLSAVLDGMISSQKEKRQKTYVARYKGQNIVTKSGKSSWKQPGHAKNAIIRHFHQEEYDYRRSPYKGERIVYGEVYDRKFSWEISRERSKQFRAKLWELIEIVELE